MDFSFLLGGNQVQLPDPTQQFARGLTLADMARRVQNSEDDYRMKDIERRANVLAAQAWGQAQQTGDIRSAVSDLSNQGEAGALALQKLTNAWRAEQESQAKQEHQRAQTQELMSKAEKGRFDVTQGRSVELRNMATAIAGSQGALPDEAIGTFMEGARALGVPENVLRQAPMQSDAFRQWAVTIADPKVLSDVTKEREITPAMVANYQASARKSNMDADMMPRETAAKEMTARASAQSAANQMAIAKMNDERARETNAVAREAAGGAKINAETQAYAKMIEGTALPNLITSAKTLNDTINSYVGKSDIPGVGPVDAATPPILRSKEGNKVRAQVQAVANDLLKLYSGGAVTANEAERRATEMMASGMFNEDDLRNAWPLIVGRINAAAQNVRAGFSPESVSTYESRGGMRLAPIQTNQSPVSGGWSAKRL